MGYNHNADTDFQSDTIFMEGTTMSRFNRMQFAMMCARLSQSPQLWRTRIKIVHKDV